MPPWFFHRSPQRLQEDLRQLRQEEGDVIRQFRREQQREQQGSDDAASPAEISDDNERGRRPFWTRLRALSMRGSRDDDYDARDMHRYVQRVRRRRRFSFNRRRSWDGSYDLGRDAWAVGEDQERLRNFFFGHMEEEEDGGGLVGVGFRDDMSSQSERFSSGGADENDSTPRSGAAGDRSLPIASNDPLEMEERVSSSGNILSWADEGDADAVASAHSIGSAITSCPMDTMNLTADDDFSSRTEGFDSVSPSDNMSSDAGVAGSSARSTNTAGDGSPRDVTNAANGVSGTRSATRTGARTARNMTRIPNYSTTAARSNDMGTMNGMGTRSTTRSTRSNSNASGDTNASSSVTRHHYFTNMNRYNNHISAGSTNGAVMHMAPEMELSYLSRNGSRPRWSMQGYDNSYRQRHARLAYAEWDEAHEWNAIPIGGTDLFGERREALGMGRAEFEYSDRAARYRHMAQNFQDLMQRRRRRKRDWWRRIAGLFSMRRGGPGGSRRSHRDDDMFDPTYEELLELEERNVKLGLTRDEIEALEVFKVGQETANSSVKAVPGEDECRICLQKVKLKEELMILPCVHWYHRECVKRWFQTNRTCPVCRKEIERKKGKIGDKLLM